MIELTIYQQILNLFDNDNEDSFNSVAMEVFKYQSLSNTLYKQYLDLINCRPDSISHYRDIPLLPISLFKKEVIKSGNWNTEKVFKSSGTMQDGLRSQHHVKSIDWYNQLCKQTFIKAGFGFDNHEILGLLPSYIENGDSSLVHMVSCFQTAAKTKQPANYLYNFEELHERITATLTDSSKKITLIGVTFALLDFAETVRIDNERLEVIFTGGMKNRKQELQHKQVCTALRKAFPKSTIRSEYGMTELLSQAYSQDESIYKASSTMRIVTKQLQDPFTNLNHGKTGILGIVDLANVDSCSFILSQDLSIQHKSTAFEVVGRMDDSDVRGCNLLYQKDYF